MDILVSSLHQHRTIYLKKKKRSYECTTLVRQPNKKKYTKTLENAENDSSGCTSVVARPPFASKCSGSVRIKAVKLYIYHPKHKINRTLRANDEPLGRYTISAIALKRPTSSSRCNPKPP